MAKLSKVVPGHELALTSVKVHKHVLELFQKQSIHKITFQALVNRAMHLYSTDPEFRNLISNYTALLPSGSL